MDEMKDRIRQIMEAQHMTQQTFANFIGMSPASLSSIFNNRTKPTLNTVEAIKGKIPNLNIEWLVFGHGSMYNDKTNVKENSDDYDRIASGGSAYDDENGEPDLFSNRVQHSSRPEAMRQSAATAKPEVRYVERPQRQITEIRVYFDDLTYETFVPKK